MHQSPGGPDQVRTYHLSGRATLAVVGGDGPAAAAVDHHMSPFRAGAVGEHEADVVLVLDGAEAREDVREVLNPARDGLTTLVDDRGLRLRIGGRSCAIEQDRQGRVVLSCGPGMPLGPLFRTVVRPALQTAAVRHAAAAVHSASVEVDGRAVLVAGWSESGKTETALALMEQGAGWLSDKWTLLGADAEASAFPVNVGVRRWVLPHLPRLSAALPRAARTQVVAAGAAARVTGPLRRRDTRGGLLGTAASAAGRVVGMIDRAALTQDQVRTAYGDEAPADRRVPLGTLVLLITVPGASISVEAADPAWAAARLAVTGAYERNDWWLLAERRRYADPLVPGGARERTIDAECAILSQALGRAQVLAVRAPFPVDPRRVAAAVEGAM